MRREAEFQNLFRHWLKANAGLFDSCAFELKQTTGDSIPFDALAEHQDAALDAVQQVETGLLYKIPDDSRGIKPFDFVYLRDADAWVVIRFPKFFVVIDRDDFEYARKHSDRKSLTGDQAREISTHYVDLGRKRGSILIEGARTPGHSA